MPFKSLNILMTPVGSRGDVLPYVGIGRALHSRGHDVTVITAEPFGAVVREAGLRFVPHLSTQEFDWVTAHPDLWHPRRGIGLILQMVGARMREAYGRIADLDEPGRTVLVGHLLSLATRVYEEKHAVAAVTLGLAPSALRTLYQVPAPVAGMDLARWPQWTKHAFWWLVDRILLDRSIEEPLNAWRRELELPAVHRIFQGWVHSPQRVIALFPDWFGQVQPDWPGAVRLTDFPLYDQTAPDKTDPQLDRFLETGTPPIVFTAGSANRQAARFFATAVDAARCLGRRALLLTQYAQQLPDPLPSWVLHRSYLRLSGLLPRCAAIVHHGGIGTSAQGLAAGVPQLVMPMGFDQPDNATRLARLSVGAWIGPARFTPKRVAAALDRLLQRSDVADACRRCAHRIAGQDAIGQTCTWIEQAATGPSDD